MESQIHLAAFIAAGAAPMSMALREVFAAR
ncbi:MAG: TRAP-type C4-dicarboxylate transport system substrate-binding protein [Paracoccaceae bacterium]|jgi:TRAP-type C4-dicarboxylate transport system substrate-binding protein